MLDTRCGSPDGWKVKVLHKDKIYDDSEIGERLCLQMLRGGVAERVYLDDAVRESMA